MGGTGSLQCGHKPGSGPLTTNRHFLHRTSHRIGRSGGGFKVASIALDKHEKSKSQDNIKSTNYHGTVAHLKPSRPPP
jgi:hypothetical protein